MFIIRTKFIYIQDASILFVDLWRHTVNMFIFRTKLIYIDKMHLYQQIYGSMLLICLYLELSFYMQAGFIYTTNRSMEACCLYLEQNYCIDRMHLYYQQIYGSMLLFMFRTKLLHRQDASIILVHPWKDAINMFADTDLLGKWHHLFCFQVSLNKIQL